MLKAAFMSTGPERVIVVRHAEKPPPLGPPAGVKEDGDTDRHSLTVRGWQRAGALANRLCRAEPELGRPDAIFSPPGGDGAGDDHARPHQTIAPAAARLGITIDDAHRLDEEDALVADVLRRAGIVLISWEHKRIARIATKIADPSLVPHAWPDERFDLFWIFDRGADGTYGFRQLPQLLLAGDIADVVPIG